MKTTAIIIPAVLLALSACNTVGGLGFGAQDAAAPDDRAAALDTWNTRCVDLVIESDALPEGSRHKALPQIEHCLGSPALSDHQSAAFQMVKLSKALEVGDREAAAEALKAVEGHALIVEDGEGRSIDLVKRARDILSLDPADDMTPPAKALIFRARHKSASFN